MQDADEVVTSGVPEAEAPAPDLTTTLRDLTGERDKLAAEKADLHDRLLRRQADFENFRRRTQRERAEYLEFAAAEALEALLPVVDDFERALKVECADKEYAKGLELIYQRFVDTLKKMGLEPVEAAGQRFDPNLHHAVEKVENPEAEEDSVIEELQRGYKFRGRLLRPAMVRVAVKER